MARTEHPQTIPVAAAGAPVDELTRLLLAARDGDRLALASAIRRAEGEVWRLCRHLVDDEDPDDLAQETWLRAWRALPAYRGDSSGRTWLLSIARKTCADAVRRRRRRRLLALRTAPLPGDEIAAGPAEGVALFQLLDVLDADQRLAFVLTQLHGLAYAEAAEVCACPVGTIRSRVARARTRLLDQVDEPARRAQAPLRSPAIAEDCPGPSAAPHS
jgi:RNA polymerase sigma-70 factor (ECF subfamily)